MPYLPNIPQPNDRLKDSQPDILANFQAIKQLIDVNHDTFSSATEGKHKWVSFPSQVANPATAPAEVAMFSKAGITAGTPSALFVRKENNAAVKSGGFTEFEANTFISGWTRLPSGILLKWGFVAPALPNPCTVTFPVGATIPVFTALYHVQLTVGNTNASDNNWHAAIVNNSLAVAQFQVWTTQRTTTTSTAVQIYYLAIGE